MNKVIFRQEWVDGSKTCVNANLNLDISFNQNERISFKERKRKLLDSLTSMCQQYQLFYSTIINIFYIISKYFQNRFEFSLFQHLLSYY